MYRSVVWIMIAVVQAWTAGIGGLGDPEIYCVIDTAGKGLLSAVRYFLGRSEAAGWHVNIR